MAGPRVVSLSSGPNGWKQWLKTCCSKKILLLLVWQVLLTFSWIVLLTISIPNKLSLHVLVFLSYLFGPLIGWLADVRFGRYRVIRFSTLSSFLASILYYFSVLTGGGVSTLSTVLLYVSIVVFGFDYICYSAAMLPFITDQIIGATSDELGSVVRWYIWAQYLGLCLSDIIGIYSMRSSLESVVSLFYAVPLAVIIISDCLCQQWLDRSHKVTNPIKLIIQVLNYTRKHRYPERRSAFTYIDEEQPTRMDYGKEKFGGPFTEEEVEDVKTVLRLLPLVTCLSVSVTFLESSPSMFLFKDYDSNLILNKAIINWLFPVVLIPLYQLLLYRCFHSCSPSMLRCIGAGLFTCTLGFILLSVLGAIGVILSDDVQRYLSCKVLADDATDPGDYVEWYWKLGPCILYGIGGTIAAALVYEFIIAQSPDKMKGFVIGIMIAFRGLVILTEIFIFRFIFTLCNQLTVSLILVAFFVVFLVLSKRYTLRERNREINIQAIAEEHYERYMDQEEEYLREHPPCILDSD